MTALQIADQITRAHKRLHRRRNYRPLAKIAIWVLLGWLVCRGTIATVMDLFQR